MGRIQGDLKARSLSFGEEILSVISSLPKELRGWVVGKQLGRCGTSIGANI